MEIARLLRAYDKLPARQRHEWLVKHKLGTNHICQWKKRLARAEEPKPPRIRRPSEKSTFVPTTLLDLL